MKRFWSNDIDDRAVVTTITLATNTNVAYLSVPFNGTLKSATSVAHGTTNTADEVLTVSVEGTTVGTITIADASSAGDVDEIAVTGSRVVSAGDVLKVATDGANGLAVNATITFVIEQSFK